MNLKSMTRKSKLALILKEGESSQVEFKESLSNRLEREYVAFANSSGGTIYIGVDDDGHIKGININNRLKSQLYDIARNCDPPISIDLEEYHDEQILAIKIDEGEDKPYQCKEGFFMRVGPSSQKLKRNEVIHLIKNSGQFSFDEVINKRFNFPKDFSHKRFEDFKRLCQIPINFTVEEILLSLNIAEIKEDSIQLKNAAVLFFAQDPQKFFPESYITCVRFKGRERFDILDKKDIFGDPIEQIEETLKFLQRHMSMQISIPQEPSVSGGVRKELYDYPLVALREAIINAVAHRDYLYDGAHVFVNLFSDYLEIENPGGLYRGITLEELGQRSIRRNRLIADLLHRAGYIERVGSGFPRMQAALKANNNPELMIASTSFFNLRLLKRIADVDVAMLTERQLMILDLMKQKRSLSKGFLCAQLNLGDDTILRELNALIKLKLVQRLGQGKATTYSLLKNKT